MTPPASVFSPRLDGGYLRSERSLWTAAEEPFWGACATVRWPSGIRNSRPPFRKHSQELQQDKAA